MLLDPALIAIVFLGTSIMPIYRRRIEKAVPRILLFFWFTFLVFFPNLFSVDVQRNVGRWLVLLLGLSEISVEIIKYFFRRWGLFF